VRETGAINPGDGWFAAIPNLNLIHLALLYPTLGGHHL
jgi:hypothetical protein